MKKLMAFVVVFFIAAGLCVPALASSGNDKAVFDLVSLGIVKPDENGEVATETLVTRAEFAAMIVRLLDLESVALNQKDEQIFEDVPVGQWFTKYINLLYSMKMVNGSGTMFDPERSVSLDEANKVLVNCLGYESIAATSGGYPDGYRITAQRIGLLKNVSATPEGLKKGDIITMIYNALDIGLMESAGGSLEVSDHTLREQLEEKEKFKGIVEANYSSYITRPYENLKKDEVVINDEIYKLGDTDADQLLGRYVEFYVLEDKQTGDKTLLSIRNLSKTPELVVDSEDVQKLTINRLEYMGDDKQLTETFDGATILKNGRIMLNVPDEIIINNGQVTLIDNTNDGAVDLVMIEDYVAGVVDRVGDQTVYFKDELEPNGGRVITLDESNKKVIFSIENMNHEIIPIEDIQPDNTVSLYASEDKKLLKLVINDKVVNGTVDSISEDELEIDGEVYRYDETLNVRVGTVVSAFFDAKDRVISVRETESLSTSYGYVIGFDNQGLQKRIKLINPGDFREVMVPNYDENNPTETAVLRGQNSAVTILDVNDKVVVKHKSGSTKYTAEELAGYFGPSHNGTLINQRVIQYKIDSEGRLKTIIETERIYDPSLGIDKSKTYNAYERVFGKSSNKPFAADETTKVLCIPNEKGVSGDGDYFATIEINNGSSYIVSGFDMDEKTKIAKLIVITTQMDAGASNPITDNSSFGVIEKVITAIDEKTQDEYLMVSIYADNKHLNIPVSNKPEVEDEVRRLKFGDVIYYSESADKKIDRVKFMASLGGEFVVHSQGSTSSESMAWGIVNDIRFDEIDDYLNRKVTVVNTTVNTQTNEQMDVLFNVRNPLPLYLIENNRIYVIDAEEIRPSDKIFSHVVSYKLKCAVIVRD